MGKNADSLTVQENLSRFILQNASEQRNAIVFGSMVIAFMEFDASSHMNKRNGK